MADFFQWLSGGSVSATIFIAVTSILVVAIVGIYTVAFFQGREISFWPPKIGEKPAPKKQSDTKKTSHQQDNDFTQPAASPVEAIFSTEPAAFDKDTAKVTDLCILGMNLRRTLTNHYGLLESKLSQGGNLKFLLVDPDSDVIPIIAERNYVYRDTTKLKTMIESALETLTQLKSSKSVKGSIEIRVLRHVPSYGLTLLDPERPTGRIRVDLYPYRVPPETYPSFWVERKADKKWYEFFRNQFYTMWEAAKPYEVSLK